MRILCDVDFFTLPSAAAAAAAGAEADAAALGLAVRSLEGEANAPERYFFSKNDLVCIALPPPTHAI